MDYITNTDTIIFAPQFNKELCYDFLLIYKKNIFSDYELNVNLFDKYLNQNLFDHNSKLKYNESIFNQKVNNLLNNLTHLILGQYFN